MKEWARPSVPLTFASLRIVILCSCFVDQIYVKRQSILKHTIDTEKASKYQVLNFMKQRMNINGMKSGTKLLFESGRKIMNLSVDYKSPAIFYALDIS